MKEIGNNLLIDKFKRWNIDLILDPLKRELKLQHKDYDILINFSTDKIAIYIPKDYYVGVFVRMLVLEQAQIIDKIINNR